MTLRHQGERGHAAARRDQMMRLAEKKAEPAADRALRQFLRHVLAAVRASMGEERPGPPQAGEPGGVADSLVAAPLPRELFTLGQALGWWTDAVASELEPALAAIWRAGYTDTSTLASSTDAVATYLANVRDRLVPDLLPGVPTDAWELARRALTEELSAGSSITQIGDRLAAEFSWSDSVSYWERRKADAYAEIDTILDPIGEPGSYAREAAKRADPRVVALREIANQATNHIDRNQNYWRTRGELIARTETNSAMSAGAFSALRDEGAGAKSWLASPGPRTRPEHAEADGQEVPIDQPFIVGGESLMFPGDPSGSASMICNCRCSLVGGGLFD